MEKAIAVLNDMVDAGVIESYAIGGAMAAVFYSEPIPTFDLDVFVALAETTAALTSLRPIYDHLGRLGFRAEKEHVVIEGVPVLFIPVYNALVEEAVEHALPKAFGKAKTRVVGPEYLTAIMLQTGRRKDMLRIAGFLEAAALDKARLKRILARHGLAAKWKRAFGGPDA